MMLRAKVPSASLPASKCLSPPRVARVPQCMMTSNSPLRRAPLARDGRCPRVFSSAGSAVATQTYKIDGKEYVFPEATVQQLPIPAQAAVFIALMAILIGGAYAACTHLGPWLAANAPGVLANGKAVAVPLVALLFTAVGVAHFTSLEAMKAMYPRKGAWGLWYLPGSPEFHVKWTGVAEILGGLGVGLNALPAVNTIWPGVQQLAALCLFYLTIAITPSNIHMFTHNAPAGVGPIMVVPPIGHLIRGTLQIVLLMGLWGIAHP